jgi:TRAP-type C4-dicarboxylate transport system substrate-binding protein
MDNLPSEAQQAILDSGSAYSDRFSGVDEAFVQTCIEQAKELGHTLTELSDEQIAVWYDLVKQPVHDKWIAATEAEGLPGQELYDDVLERTEAVQ